ncbi:MAG: lysophospholipid acyltransferase family protein, partial [Cyclobacteriaceae bacterium]
MKKYTREFYNRFAEYAMETVKVFGMNERNFARHHQIEFDPRFDEIVMEGKPVLLLTSHIFNWEWTLHALVVKLDIPVHGVYQKLSSKLFDKYMYDSRRHTGAELIEKSHVLRDIAKNRDKQRCIALLADQSPRKNTKKYWTYFLNQETAFFTGPDMIAKLGNYPAFFYNVKRIKKGFYKIKVEYLMDPPYEKGSQQLLEKYVQALDNAIQQDPPGYLWSHRRWKLKREATEPIVN